MRFAHLGDTHLGNRQYGLVQREQDYYDTFNRVISRIIDEDVDCVIHSGDVFDNHNPSPNSLRCFRDALYRLKEAGIPVYAISGNHDIVMRTGMLSPVEIFDGDGLTMIRPNKPVVVDDTIICGFDYLPSSRRKTMLEYLDECSRLAEDYSKAVLVLHQGLKEFLDIDGAYELELNELPVNFDYYALGHLHHRYSAKYGRGGLVYPSCMEINKVNEVDDIYNRGFCIVDVSDDGVSVENINLTPSRMQYNLVWNIKDVEKELKSFKKDLPSEHPIVNITIIGGTGVDEWIHDELDDKVLNLRIKYVNSKVEMKRLDDYTGVNLDPRTTLYEVVLNKYKDKKVADLSVSLFDCLKDGNVDDAKILAKDYFKENY